jgi:hypothetical protein
VTALERIDLEKYRAKKRESQATEEAQRQQTALLMLQLAEKDRQMQELQRQNAQILLTLASIQA